MRARLLLLSLCVMLNSVVFPQNITIDTIQSNAIRKLEKLVKELQDQAKELQDKIKALPNNVTAQVNKASSIQDKKMIPIQDKFEEKNNELQETNNRQDESIKELKDASLLSTLPVGTIVMYYGNNPPSNWAICDGHQVTDPKSPYYGKNLLDLRGLFVRGKTSSESLCDEGGQDYVNGHTHYMPEHKHEVGSHTHTFTTNSASISANKSGTNSDEGLAAFKGFPNSQFFLAAPYQSSFEQATSHSHTGTTGNASSGYTAMSGSGNTESSGGHYNIPRYVAFNYIIKIK